MGTNYYAESSVHGVPVRLHIGKSSVGWKFLFAQYDNLRSWQEWKAYLEQPNVSIVDEHDDTMGFVNFSQMVWDKQHSPGARDFLNASVTDWGPDIDRGRSEYVDKYGYRFCKSDPEAWS